MGLGSAEPEGSTRKALLETKSPGVNVGSLQNARHTVWLCAPGRGVRWRRERGRRERNAEQGEFEAKRSPEGAARCSGDVPPLVRKGGMRAMCRAETQIHEA